MVELVMSLMLWISTATGWAIPEPPNITYIEDGRKLFLMSYGCDTEPNQDICKAYTGENGATILALYNNETKTVFLNKDFWPTSTKDQSILLHELVHHMQYSRDYNLYRRKCQGEIEKEAYDLQEKWLANYGWTLQKTIDLGPLLRHILTNCDLAF